MQLLLPLTSRGGGCCFKMVTDALARCSCACCRSGMLPELCKGFTGGLASQREERVHGIAESCSCLTELQVDRAWEGEGGNTTAHCLKAHAMQCRCVSLPMQSGCPCCLPVYLCVQVYSVHPYTPLTTF